MLILASRSPRRREMLSRLGLVYTAMDAGVDETTPESMSPENTVLTLAQRKALAVVNKVSPGDFVIAADTVVSYAGKIYGKPKDAADAYRMLMTFSGHTHEVLTGFAIAHNGGLYAEAVKTRVQFRHLSGFEVNHYIEKEKPFDKAGAYGIQEMASIFITGIEGSFDNVVGLPLTQIEQALWNRFQASLFDFAEDRP